MAHVVVLVLGDVGRSPRMQYHALSIANMDAVARVTLVGYSGEALHPLLAAHPRVTAVRFPPGLRPGLPPPTLKGSGAAILRALGTALRVAFILLAALPRADALVLQNPPCVPALPGALLCRALRGTVLCIDWHNLGFSMIEDKYGRGGAGLAPRHPLARASWALELALARCVERHACVSTAMSQWLSRRFGIHAPAAPDRPPAAVFGAGPPSPADRHALLQHLGLVPAELGLGGAGDGGDGATIQTAPRPDARGAPCVVPLLERKAFLVVSSTSWTPDEDFGLLLDAVVELDARLAAAAAAGAAGPLRAVFVVTGKGPLRAAYEERMARLPLRRCALRTLWLEPGDYPRLMRCADLGVCLHTSTSKLDLPMKVLDMFGSGVPVCAVRYEALPELVRHGENGLLFDDARGLCDCMAGLFAAGTDGVARLERLARGAAGLGTWEDSWEASFRPVVEDMLRLAAARQRWIHMMLAAAAAVAAAALAVLLNALLFRCSGRHEPPPRPAALAEPGGGAGGESAHGGVPARFHR